MKRYLLSTVDLDTRANILRMEDEAMDSWDEQAAKMMQENVTLVKELIRNEFGSDDFDLKLTNFKEIGALPLSIQAFHNKFFKQAINSFVGGNYYPALTAAASLGERILNHLIIALREDFKSTQEYKEIADKQSCDDWSRMIRILKTWKVLLPDVVVDFQKLEKLRHRKAIHFNPETDTKDRPFALEAIHLLAHIIQCQFGWFNPWIIKGTRGSFFIQKKYEQDPFVKKIFLPNCTLVGPYYKTDNIGNGRFRITDGYPYENREISDEEFADLFANKHKIIAIE